MTMPKTCQSQSKSSYSTTDLKLSALILSEILDSTAEVFQEGNYSKKMIKVTYSRHYQKEVTRLINDFINRRAKVDVFLYNKALNVLRDKLRAVQ